MKYKRTFCFKNFPQIKRIAFYRSEVGRLKLKLI